MATTLICKISSDSEIRRFTCQVNSVTYASIHKRAKDILGIQIPFRFQYKDDEGDVITMSTDEEMAEAVSLALTFEPAVLRLTVKTGEATHGESPAKNETKAPAEEPDLMNLVKGIEKSLPSIINHLPSIFNNLPPGLRHGCAAAASATAAQAARATPKPSGYGDTNVHPGVSCDKTGMCPIVGNRYHLLGHDYDLCEAEFNKLSTDEQATFEKILPPFGACTPSCAPPMASTPETPRHWGVTCDKSGMHPIVGNRYRLIGQNYDLCEAEFNKISAAEQAKFEKIPAPTWTPRCGGRQFWKHMGGHHGHMGGHHGHFKHLGARFVCDVAVFDGTQVAQSTPFTKIWRLKNTGDTPWPCGTKIVFVGGDSMSSDQSVPLTCAKVMPGEDVDVAVAMIAPKEVGRYIGYWRLAGPHERRFGQKVWCHVQVVDPTGAPEEDFVKAQEEVAALMAKVTHDDDDDAEGAEAPFAPPPPPALEPSMASSSASLSSAAVEAFVESPKPSNEAEKAAEEKAEEKAVASQTEVTVANQTKPDVGTDAASDAGSTVLVGDGDLKASIATDLLSMGFTDDEMVEHVIEKNGLDVEACARDLVTLSEQWETMLADLSEMGFQNTPLNKKLLVKNNGSVKRTVKDLVADPIA